jgi:alpha-L-arabinofuranosidase
VVTQPADDLDVAAAWTPDRKAITVSIVNATATPRILALELRNSATKDNATVWEITGPSPEAHNEPNGYANVIRAVEKRVPFEGKLRAPAYSAELYRLEVD